MKLVIEYLQRVARLAWLNKQAQILKSARLVGHRVRAKSSRVMSYSFSS
jgi:hypothetical protein